MRSTERKQKRKDTTLDVYGLELLGCHLASPSSLFARIARAVPFPKQGANTQTRDCPAKFWEEADSMFQMFICSSVISGLGHVLASGKRGTFAKDRGKLEAVSNPTSCQPIAAAKCQLLSRERVEVDSPPAHVLDDLVT